MISAQTPEVSTVPPSGRKNVTKRLADGTIKRYTYGKQIKKQIDCLFSKEEEKKCFESKLDNIKTVFGKHVKLSTIIEGLIDHYLLHNSSTKTAREQDPISPPITVQTDGNIAAPKQALFEISSINNLVTKTEEHGKFCKQVLYQESSTRHGHAVKVNYRCTAGHSFTWVSSSKMGQTYVVNYRVYLAYLCSGITPTQYSKFCRFNNMGQLSQPLYKHMLVLFSAAVELLHKQSVYAALEEERQYADPSGISIMSDARHACRKNSFHSDIVTIGQSSHKVVDIQHVTKEDEPSSQKHEAVGTRKMYERFKRLDVKVSDHAHDRNTSVNTIVANQQVHNSNDRWHAAKSIRKRLKVICNGARSKEGKTWSSQLSDKLAGVRNHFYWAMDNSNGDPTTLREMLDIIPLHYQNDHNSCHEDSPCKEPGYMPEWEVVTDATAIRLLTDFVRKSIVYRNPSDYIYGRDTYYVESYNNTVLLYIDKRIHYKDIMYKVRSNISVLDWNEHVDRPYTSRSLKRAPRANTGKKTYKRKTFAFVEDIWTLICHSRLDVPDPSVQENENSDAEIYTMTDEELILD